MRTTRSTRRQATEEIARERRAARQRAREEVVEILAEALWSLICAGRGPGAEGAAPGDDISSQPMENAGV